MDTLLVNDTKVCVLGGTGFIGNHLLKILSGKDIKLKVLSRDKTKATSSPGDIQFVVGDIEQLDSLVKFLEPGCITINLAYLNSKSIEENLKAIHNLVIAGKQVGMSRLVHCSTAVVVGRTRDNVITEDTKCLPLTEYEKTKLEIENILFEGLNNESELVIVRPTAVFGKNGRNLVKLTNELTGSLRLKALLKTALFPKRKMNLVCVENVAQAISFLACYKGDLSGIYIVSDDDDEENNYYDVSRLLCHHLNFNPVRLFCLPFQNFLLSSFLGLLRRSNTNPQRVYSSDKLLKLGYQKAVIFQDGIRHFATWYNDSISKENSCRSS